MARRDLLFQLAADVVHGGIIFGAAGLAAHFSPRPFGFWLCAFAFCYIGAAVLFWLIGGRRE
jgi:hypothetical protein